MIAKILEGVKEVVTEVGSGLKDASSEVFTESNAFMKESNAFFKVLNTKMMGSYEDIEKVESEKNNNS